MTPDAQGSLMDAIRSLHQMPEHSPFLEAEFIPPNKYYKMFVEKWYIIIYQVKDQAVYVDMSRIAGRNGWLVR